jgi:hypothetical protein
MKMLLHRHEHSCCIVKLSTACSLSLLSNFESHLVLFQQTMWCYVYWCPISCMNTWILFPIVYVFVWPLYFICKFKLNYYLQFCDHCDPVPMTKLISKLWWIDVIFVTKVMENLWPFYIKRWRWQITFYDDFNLSSMTFPNRWRHLPRHWWRQIHVSSHVIADVSATSEANTVNGRLWPKHRNICDQIWSSQTSNAVNGAVRQSGAQKIMTKTESNPRRKTIITDWTQIHDDNFFITD